MKLELLRISSENESTLGVLYILTPDFVGLKQKKMIAFTIEDEHRNVKKPAETRIPAGTYSIELRKHGGFHNRYSQRFSWHEGMLELQDVPNFTDILIHIGNDDEDTAGCILVAESAQMNVDSDGFIGNSTETYREVYQTILSAIKAGEDVSIKIRDYDFI